MPSCPQCHAPYSPEELDVEKPVCPTCGEAFATDAESAEFTETEDHDPLNAAPRIEGFEITRHIGRGGMGDVWEARQNVLGRKVAIKVLAKNLSHSEHFLARFTREAFTLGRLQHPGIVSIYDFRSSPDGLCCIIMEFVEGPRRGEPTTLYDLIVGKELTPERTRFLILQVLHSLQYAHEEGVIHRDIKPTNVLIDRYGRVKVVDFGIAAMPSDPNRKQLTYVGGPLGTAEYMAPEQTEDATKADHRADLYAVGVVIYEMLTGIRPRGLFAMPSKVNPDVEPAWDDVVNKSLQADRELRYANAQEMIEAIQAIRGGTTSVDTDSFPQAFLPPAPGEFPGGIGEVQFDEEPEEFPRSATPLPTRTPTADLDPAAQPQDDDSSEHPDDTQTLLHEEDREIPAWMVKRRRRVESLEETQADSSDQEGEEAAPKAQAGMDSTMRLDRRESESEAEEHEDVSQAESGDLDVWLDSGPAPKSKDSANLIEVTSAAAKTPPSSGEPLEGSVSEDAIEEKVESPPPEPSRDDLPEGDFVELCLDAATTPAKAGDAARLFRPAVRPPTIRICVLDDGSKGDGDWIRVRKPRFVIGRKEGDLIIGHDRNISSRHAEISMRDIGEGTCDFFIQDLKTTNGTFARASRATLEDGQEFLLGYRRYQLVCDNRGRPGEGSFDKLVEVNRRGTGKSYRLGHPPIIIGRDPTSCNLLILDDPFLSPVHAILKRDRANRWVIKNYNSRNGIWIKIDEMKLVSGGEFQIGSQRLIVLL